MPDFPWQAAVREEAAALTETSETLLDALATTIGRAIGRERVETLAYHTGGGCMVAAVDLSIDARLIGRQLWLTREERWVLGFYDFHTDPDDFGVCVELMVTDPDDPQQVADAVAAILARLGVTTLQGE